MFGSAIPLFGNAPLLIIGYWARQKPHAGRLQTEMKVVTGNHHSFRERAVAIRLPRGHRDDVRRGMISGRGLSMPRGLRLHCPVITRPKTVSGSIKARRSNLRRCRLVETKERSACGIPHVVFPGNGLVIDPAMGIRPGLTEMIDQKRLYK